nr:reverse transcriptase zinc-binding domain-containing protein [Tanacetum cinerariifolium]
MQLDERELHKKGLGLFEKLKTQLGFLYSSFNFLSTRLFEITFRIFFREVHQTFREKMYRNLNQLQWQLERDNFYGHVSMTCLVVLRTQFKEFFDSKEVNASDVQNKCWQKNFIDGTKWEPKNYRRLLLRYLEELDKLIDERVLKYVELRIKEKEVQAIKEIEKRLKESDLHQQESLITEGAAIEACLVTKGAVLEACLVNEGIILNNNTSVTKSSGTKSKNNNAQQPHATFPQLDLGLVVLTFLPTIDLIACLHKEMAFMSTVMASRFLSTNNQLRTSSNLRNKLTFKMVGLLFNKFKEDKVLDVSSILGNENRSSNYKGNSLGNDVDAKKMLVDMSASDIKNDDIGTSYDSDKISEVHPDMFEIMFAHGIQNHKQPKSSPDTFVVNENNSDITSDILNMDPDRGKEEHDDVNYVQERAFFASLINNLKCDVEKYNEVNREAQQANALLKNELERYKEKTFSKENEKYDEYVKPLLKRKDKLEKKNQEFLKQINDLDKRLRKARQTDQTLRMLLPKEDNVNTRKQGLGFENQNNNANPSVLNKAKELAPCLYNIEEMGKDEHSDHKIISKEELKCEAEKRLKVKQRKSPLSYHSFVYVETQFEEPLKVPLKKKKCQFERTFGTSSTEKL